MHVFQHIKYFLRLSADQPINSQVRLHYKHNFIVNTIDATIYLMGESFVSMNTILPVFASTLTDSAILIGLVPALINAGWFIPQFLLAGHVKRLPRVLPFAKRVALIERIPYLLLPLSAYLLHWVSKDTVLLLFFIVVALRGVTGGIVALPWQEVIALVIPNSARNRFFGFSNTIGRIFAVIGSAIAGFIFAELKYPNNYALNFLIGALLIWLSYIFFIRTIEPATEKSIENIVDRGNHEPLIDFSAFKQILGKDKNFRHYLTSRGLFHIGSMAGGFLAVYGIKNFSLLDEQAAIFSGLLFASGTVGFTVWGMLGDRVRSRNILLISDLLQVIVLIVAVLSPTVWVFYLVFLIFGFAQSGFIIGDLVLAMELGDEKDRPIYIGLSRSIPGVLILIAPLIGGSLVSWVGYQSMFLVAIGFTLAGFLFLTRVKERTIAQ